MEPDYLRELETLHAEVKIENVEDGTEYYACGKQRRRVNDEFLASTALEVLTTPRRKEQNNSHTSASTEEQPRVEQSDLLLNDVKSEPESHSVTPNLPPQKSREVCSQCGKTFLSKFGLRLHRKNDHLKQYKYTCDECGKGYNQRTAFNFHVAGHSNKTLSQCSFCGKIFKGHCSLARHASACKFNPDKVKRESFVCDICDQSFSTKEILGNHTRGKHGPKKYQCSRCSRLFSWRSSLRVHSKLCKDKNT